MKYGKSITNDGGYSRRKHILETIGTIEGVSFCGKDVPKMTMTVRAKQEELCKFCLYWYKKKHGEEHVPKG